MKFLTNTSLHYSTVMILSTGTDRSGQTTDSQDSQIASKGAVWSVPVLFPILSASFEHIISSPEPKARMVSL